MSDNKRKRAVLESGITPGVIADLFPVAQKTGTTQILVHCPFHDDSNPSLSINTTSGLFNCFGCGQSGNLFDLYMKVKGLDFYQSLTSLESLAGITDEKSARHNPAAIPRVVATFTYHDKAGKRCYWKKRYEPGFGKNRKKSFAFYHLENGREKKGRGCKPLLYNLHLLVTAPDDAPFFILEGEAKADLLTGWGLSATSLDSGGKSAWQDEFNTFFSGRTVYLLPDNDSTGEAYCATIAGRLLPVARKVKILRLPGLPEKGDIIDWVKIQRGVT